jgi:ribosomal protein S18 acetylase RimI-like enzyme
LKVGPLERSELDLAAGVLARAFCDNPLNRAVIRAGEARRERANRAGVRAYLPLAHERAHVAVARADAALLGVLVATPPWRWPLPPPGPLGTLRLLFGQGFRVARRWSEVSRRLRAHHPGQPHWYLATLGVEPSQWGRGAGRALLADLVLRVDADATPAYLETDRPELERYYRSAGFELRERVQVYGVPVLLMERPARPASGGPTAFATK